MYQFRSATTARRDPHLGARSELDRLREENELLRSYMAAAQPVLANLALNPFAEADDLRRDARAALAVARRHKLLSTGIAVPTSANAP